MKQADSSLLFPLLVKALERNVSPRVNTIHKFSLLDKFAYMAISPDRSRHSFSEKFGMMSYGTLTDIQVNAVR